MFRWFARGRDCSHDCPSARAEADYSRGLGPEGTDRRRPRRARRLALDGVARPRSTPSRSRCVPLRERPPAPLGPRSDLPPARPQERSDPRRRPRPRRPRAGASRRVSRRANPAPRRQRAPAPSVPAALPLRLDLAELREPLLARGRHGPGCLARGARGLTRLASPCRGLTRLARRRGALARLASLRRGLARLVRLARRRRGLARGDGIAQTPTGSATVSAGTSAGSAPASGPASAAVADGRSARSSSRHGISESAAIPSAHQ